MTIVENVQKRLSGSRHTLTTSRGLTQQNPHYCPKRTKKLSYQVKEDSSMFNLMFKTHSKG